jgi:hypothetical protein
MTYQDFSEKIRDALLEAKRPLTWTEIRTAASLPQAFPNNQWVHRMEQDIGLYRHRDHNGVIHWQLGGTPQDAAIKSTAPSTKPDRTRANAKKNALE